MEWSPNGRGRGRLRKTMGKIVRKDLGVNGLDIDMIYDKT